MLSRRQLLHAVGVTVLATPAVAEAQATKSILINVTAARGLHLPIPPSLLVRADQVVR